MKYWDSSALVPLLLTEPGTAAVRELLESDCEMVTFWTTEIECVSALARREREGLLQPGLRTVAWSRLAALRDGWSEVLPREAVRRRALRLLRVHPLRTADSLQLAAAITAAEDAPSTLPFVCLDRTLRRAAEKEGFPLLPLGA